MAEQRAATPPAQAGGTLLFDGDCGFCTTAANRAMRISPHVAVVPYQRADLPTLGVTAEQARSALQFIGAHGIAAGSDAVGRFLLATGGMYAALGRLLLLPGIRSLARPAYRLIAANRQRLPGGTPACRLDP